MVEPRGELVIGKGGEKRFWVGDAFALVVGGGDSGGGGGGESLKYAHVVSSLL